MGVGVINGRLIGASRRRGVRLGTVHARPEKARQWYQMPTSLTRRGMAGRAPPIVTNYFTTSARDNGGYTVTSVSQTSMMTMNGTTARQINPNDSLNAAMATIRFNPTGGVR